jgi:hypothetical protein
MTVSSSTSKSPPESDSGPATPAVPTVAGYVHQVATHCETGSLRNLLSFSGIAVSEPLLFGVGSGPAFYHLFFAKGPSTFPLVGIRSRPGSLMRNTARRCGLDVVMTQHRTAREASVAADRLIADGVPVAASVDMFRMKYLPSFLRVHAPFHFIVLVGRRGDMYAVSDPYSEQVAHLSRDDLEASWETHAPLARDNLVCWLRQPPGEIDWRAAIREGIRATCRAMLPPPGIRRLLWFVGVQGMRTYARKVAAWSHDYRGVRLREGMIFNAIAFEDQGTGGAAFRLMYGAFLQEVARRFEAEEIRELAEELIAHGRAWRAWSRQLVVLARPVPMDDDAYDDWYASSGEALREGLAELGRSFMGFADVELHFFERLRRAADRLP